MTRGRSNAGKYMHKPGHRSTGLYDGDGAATYDLNTPVLSEVEQSKYQQYETEIKDGLETFYKVGAALMAIRDGRLYRADYATFEDYCQERWQLKERYAYKLMDAADVIDNLKVAPLGQLPDSERQARPLTSLPPEQQAAAWQSAVETAPNGRVTAAHVQSVVDEIKTPPRTRVTYGPSEDDYQDDVPSAQVDEADPSVGANNLDTLTSAYAAATTWEEAQKLPPGRNNYSENEAEWLVGGRGAKVKTAAGHIGTVVFASGRFVWVDTVNGRRQYAVENLTRLDGVVGYEPSVVTPPVIPNYKRDSKTARPVNEHESHKYDSCQTPAYALDPLLPYLGWSMPSKIWEPAAGEGLLVNGLYDAGWTEEHVISSDILTGQNFFEYEPADWDIIVTNPPFSLKFKWLERAYALDKPFALLLPVEVLGTKTAQELMQKHGFEIMLLNRRVSFKMPNAGWNGGGAQFSTMWFCWHLLPQQVMFGNIEYPSDEQEDGSDD